MYGNPGKMKEELTSTKSTGAEVLERTDNVLESRGKVARNELHNLPPSGLVDIRLHLVRYITPANGPDSNSEHHHSQVVKLELHMPHLRSISNSRSLR